MDQIYAGFKREKMVPSDKGGKMVADESKISILGKWVNSGVNNQIEDKNMVQIWGLGNRNNVIFLFLSLRFL